MTEKKNYIFFKRNGYLLIKIFSKSDIKFINNTIKNKINSLLGRKNKIKSLENYHKIVSDKEHLKIVNGKSRNIALSKKILAKIFKNKKILHLTKNYWKHNTFSLNWVGNLKKKQVKRNVTGFRIARPVLYKNNILTKKDVGGVHFDLFYGGRVNNNYKSLMTIWCPIVGFSNKFTLNISPKSHLIKHYKKYLSKQSIYISPVFLNNYTKKFKFFRPNLQVGQAIIFHPNLLHGASNNIGSITRVSIDLRIFNKDFI